MNIAFNDVLQLCCVFELNLVGKTIIVYTLSFTCMRYGFGEVEKVLIRLYNMLCQLSMLQSHSARNRKFCYVRSARRVCV